MSLKELLDEGRLEPRKSSLKEITQLAKIVDRDLKDASVKDVSPDRRFATAYNAILQLATIVIRASGYRVRGEGHHRTTFIALRALMTDLEEKGWRYFDACRQRKN